MKKRLLLTLFLGLLSSSAFAAALTGVNVNAPAVNCVFDLDCTITVTDTSDTIALPGGAGTGFLQSRTFPTGEPGTQAEGLYGYEYRIDLREIAGILAVPSVVTFTIDFGRPVPLDYDGDGVTEHYYIVTTGGLGTTGPGFADLTGNTISFHFYATVPAGQSSFFFGMASRNPPRSVTAHVTETLTASVIAVAARAPAVPRCLSRPDLNDDLTAAERDVLDDLVLSFIDECVIGEHYTAGIHSTGMLLPWHRNYIGELENSLILAGHPEFVPLPKWNPANPIPAEFQDIDPSCPTADTAVCAVTAPPEGPFGCAALVDTTPGVATPSSLFLPDLCEYATRDELTSGGVSVARPGVTGFHNTVHCAVGGSMCTFHSPSADIFWPWHSYVDDIWASWECNCNFLFPFALNPFPEDLLTPCRIVPCWVAWWPMEDPHIFDPLETMPMVFRDIRGEANALIPFGNPTPIPGRVGTALSFDGVDDFLRTPSHPELNVGTNDMSIDLWYMTRAMGRQPLVEKRDSSGIGFSFFSQDGMPGFEMATAAGRVSAMATMNVADGMWWHVAVTVDRDSQTGGRLFVDGKVAMTFDPTPAQGDLSTPGDLLIGAGQAAAGQTGRSFFAGALDEVDLLKRILKPSEIAGIFEAGAAGKLGAIVDVTPVVFREICNGKGIGEPGGRVTIPITLDDGNGVAGFQVDLSFNPAVLSPVSVGLGADTAAAGGWTVFSAPVGPGVLRIVGESSPPTGLSPGPKEVALVEFDILAAAPIGPTPLSESNCVLSDKEGLPIPCRACQKPGVVIVRNASSFRFFPLPPIAGVDEFNPLPFGVSVEALDSSGNRATGYSRMADMSLISGGLCPPDALQPMQLSFAGGLGGPDTFSIFCCPGPVTALPPLALQASDPPLEITGTSGPFSGIVKADLDASMQVDVLDVLRDVRLTLGQSVPQPPPPGFQTWAGNMLDDHCLVDGVINILDVVRVRNKSLGRPPLCPCGGPFGGLPGTTAQVAGAATGTVSIRLEKAGPRSFLVVVSGARDLGGLQFDIKGATPITIVTTAGLTAGQGWQVFTVPGRGNGMRVVAFGSGAGGVSGDGAVLRITGSGNPRLTAITASDAEGREIQVR